MTFNSWLRQLRTRFTPARARHKRSRRPQCLRPSLEQLEDRLAPALLTVNSLADTSVLDGSNSSGLLTLRDAVLVENGTLAIANLSLSEQTQISGTPHATGADTIQFASTLAGQTINLTAFDDASFGNSAFLVNSQLTIQGDPSLGITIARDTNVLDYPGNQLLNFRLFDVAATGNLTLSNVTLANGLAQGGDGGSQTAGGGGGGGAGLGGAVFNDGGSVTMVACTLTSNTAQGGQGGTLSGTAIDGGGVGAGGGGAGTSDGGAYGGSSAGGFGVGGDGNGPGLGGGFGGGGGGGNYGGSGAGTAGGAGGFGAGGGGGGGGAFGAGGPGAAGGFGGGTGTSGGNESAGNGGGGAGLGGAIFNAAGTLVITNTSLTGNTAQGGTANGGDDGSAYGGAIFNLNGSVTLTGDTLSGNTVAAATSADGTDLYSLGADGVLASAAGSATTIGSAAGAVVGLAAQTTLGDGTGGTNNLVNNNSNLYTIDHFTGGDAGNPTDWNDALNWDNGIPGTDSEVIIPATGTIITSASAVSIAYIQSLAPVDITADTFQLTGDGVADTGTFIVADGATLGFDDASASSTIILGAGSSISGAGTVEFGNGAVNIVGTYDITGNTLVDGGSLNVNAGANVQSVGTLTISSGTVNFSSGQVIDLAALTMSGGTLAGPDDVSVAGLLDWTGGTIAGNQPGSQASNPFSQAGSAFTTTPVDITNFSTQFTFQLLPVNDPGNDDIGITFTLQGTGPTALGSNNIYLGAYPIANSVSVEFNIGALPDALPYGNWGNSTNWFSDDSNGKMVASSGFQYLFDAGIDLNNTDPCTVNMTYDGTTLQVTILDTITQATATQSYTMDIPALIGSSSAYVGFTGSTGPIFAAEQSILSWQYAAGGANVDFSQGFASTTGLSLNGSAISSQGQLQLTDGGQPEISAEGGLQLGAAGDANDTETLGRILNNAGAATWAGGGSFNQLYSTFNNLAGASFTIENGLDWSSGQYDGDFNNAGSLIVANGGATTTIGSTFFTNTGSAFFVNTGSVEVQSGTLTLTDDSGDAGDTGSFTVDLNATLEFAGSNDEVNLDAGSSISGAGTVQFDQPNVNNSVNIAGTYDITGATIINGCYVTFTSSASLGSLSMTSNFSYGSALNVSGSGTTVTATGPTNIYSAGILPDGEYPDPSVLDVSSGATLDLPNLSALYFVNIGVATGGTLQVNSALTSLDEDSLTLDGTGTLDTSRWTSFTNGSINIGSGSYTLAGLTDFDSSGVNLSGGAVLSLPKVTSYSQTSPAFTTFTVDGAGTLLDLSAVVSIPNLQGFYVQVTNGGEINFAKLPTLNLNGNNFNVYDAGSKLDFASLKELANGNFGVFNDATLFAPDLTTLINANVNSDGTGTLDIGIVFTAYAPSEAEVGVVYSYQFQAIGAGTMTYSATGLPGWARLDPSGLLTGTPPTTGLFSFSVTASNGSAPDRTVAVNWSVGSEVFNIDAGATVFIPTSDYLFGTIFNVGAGASVSIGGGSSFGGGTVFNVAPGATVDLTGGGTVTYSGTLTGTGSGTVQFSAGNINPAVGGVTLNFPGNMFQWTGGVFLASLGDVTNLGTMNLAGSSDKGLFDDGILYNYGTIIQTGSGNLDLHSDSVSPTTLLNEAGASYLIESDSGIDNFNGGKTALINNGLIDKTAGMGTSTLFINGPFSDTGTIEADSGTLSLNAISIAQVSGTTLTAGTWNALDGATLEFPAGTAITSNAATIVLGGSGANIAGIGALAANSSSFSLTNGAAFTTPGGFTNSGSLTLGTAATLTVAGNFTQTSTGTLNEQIGGTPGSGQFGQLSLTGTGTATLAGAFDLALVDGFTASAGQQFQVMSFAGASGTFSSANLGAAFAETINPTGLDLNSTVANPTNLSVSNVDAPTAATAGQQITVTWQVTNTSATDNATGTWQDSVYLSATPAITFSSLLLGSAEYGGGLLANVSYKGILKATLPALAPGFYYVIVEADSLYQVAQTSRANDILAAGTGQLDVTLPTLTLGTAANGSFSAAGQESYYQITVPAGGSLNVSLQSDASAGALALYVSQGNLPTPYNYQQAAVIANLPNQTAVVPQVLTAGTYYILAYSVSGAAVTAGYTITATQTTTVSVSAISPYSGGNAGNVTVEIDGANFTPEATANLTLGGITIHDSTMDFVNASQMFATFNLSGAAVGSYTLSVHQGAPTATAPSTFQVVAANTSALSVDLSVPQYVRSGRTGTIVIAYANNTDNDLVAPWLDISSTNSNVSFSTPDDPNAYVQTAQVLAVAPSGPAGILRPGQSGQITLTLMSSDTIDGDQIPVTVSQVGADQTIDWASLQASLQPAGIPAAAWSVIYGNFLTMVGSTTNFYNAALAQAATYLSGLGGTMAQVSDVGSLFSFLVSQADAEFPTTSLTAAIDASLATPGSLSLAIDRIFNSSIAGRATPGIFGLGWTTPWQTSLSHDSSGNATVNSGGVTSYFPIQANGSYLDTDAKYGTLALSDGLYTFTDTSGTQSVFLPNGLLSYEQDTNGNRITLGYNGQNQLVTLTYSNPSDPSEPGEQLSLTYNSQGFVSQESDGIGDVWTFTYDPAGHLLSVTAPGPTATGLTTSYSYDTGSNPETANALLSITNPDGTQQNFTYDSLGRLSGTSANGGTLATTYVYLGEGEVKETDSAGDQTIVWFNELGLPGRVQDPLGGISTSLYDTNGNVISTTDPAGNTSEYAYDSNGNLVKTVNPLGQTVPTTHGSLGKLTSITDAGGNTTQYNYDSAGNLLSIAYPGGTQQSSAYDPLGNLSETIDQNGDPINYQYNAEGQVTQENFADGTSQTYTYDAHGNMLTAQTFDSSGNLTGATTLTYDNGNELTSITYPSGQYLNFTYNAQGQRIQSVDQSCYTLTYSYDALGRLVGLTDGLGMVVTYTYNNLGQLSGKQNGNGTYTTYAYDAAGNLTSEINYAPGGAINSSYAYTYNVLNEVTTVTDAAGNVTTYGYDVLGQLTQVTLPGGQSIIYVYDAAGNRTEVINNGAATNYTSNADNQITQAGATTYTYDANGNLLTATDAGGTTTYGYNDQNQLVSIIASHGTVTTFEYSPLGFMTGMIVNGTETDYLVNPAGLGNVVSAYDGSGALIADYNYGLGLVSQTGPSGTGYYDFGAAGNTVGITGSSGSYVNQYSYLPFGETTTVSAALPNPFTFAGQAGVMQIGGNLFYMRARDYTPATGQFTSRDPLGLAGGDANIRRYVGNNPVGSIDPTGLASSVQSLISQYAAMYGLDPNLVAALVQAESGGNPNAVGDGGRSLGLLQLNPANYGGTNLLSPEQNLKAGLETLAFLLKNSGGNIPRALAAFDGHRHPKDDPIFISQVLRRYQVTNKTSNDPNALIGPAGYGTPAFLQPTGTLPYTIDFENDGSAAAQDVTVTEQLDPNLDWSTFQLGSFGFGPVNVNIPAGLTQYQTTVSYQNSDGSSLNVQVSLDFSVATGLLTATFVSLDPLTGQAPTGVFDGFLYPENGTGGGEGYVQYTVDPKAGLTTQTTNGGVTTATTINQQASVVFDTNPPLNTAVVTNSIDACPPTSSVTTLPPTETSSSFPVSWSGTDDAGGSGIAGYDIYVSEGDGPFTLFMTAPGTQTSATFTGQSGQTYGFYSVATDNVGNVEATPAVAQATTEVQVASTITPTITWANPADITYGTPLGQAQLDATASATSDGNTVNVMGTFTYTLADGTTLATGAILQAGLDQILNVSFTPTDTTDYTTATTTASINVTKALLSVTVNNQNKVYAAALPTLTGTLAGVVNGDNITVTYSTTATAPSDVVVGGYPITATLNDPGSRLGNYAVTNTPGTLTIAQATQHISWSNPADIVVGTALSAAQLNATVAVVGPAAAGAITYTPASDTVLGSGNGQALTVNVAGTTDYQPATGSVLINVLPLSPSGKITTDTPTFAWTAVAGITTYDLWIGDNTSGQQPVFENKTVTTNWFSLATVAASQALTPGHSYTWWAGAVSGKNISWGTGTNFSVAALAAPTATPLSTPQATDQPSFSWQAVSAGATYEVWVTDLTTNQYQTVSGITGTSLNWPAGQALTPGDKFTWWVGSVSTNGKATTWNAGQNFTVTPLVAPTATPVTTPQATDQPSFSWQAAAGAATYEVWITDVTTKTYQTISGITGTSLNWPAGKALTPGDKFTWWVGSVSTNGKAMVWNAGQTFTVTPLAAPTATVIASPQTTDQPSLSWQAATDAATYEVWITNLTTQTYQTVSGITATSLNWPATKALTPGDNFEWWVGSVSTNGQATTWNAGQTFTVAPLAAPAANPIAATQTTTQPSFSWQAATDAATYEVWITNLATKTYQTVSGIVATSLNWPATKALTPGDNFEWWVGSVSTNGQVTTWNAGQTFTVAITA